MDGQNIGWLLGLGGALIGLLGGLFGTWCSVRNTKGPRERTFVLRASLVCWIAVGLFVALMSALPHPWRLLLWIPYAILLPLGIRTWNRRQQQIRAEEASTFAS